MNSGSSGITRRHFISETLLALSGIAVGFGVSAYNFHTRQLAATKAFRAGHLFSDFTFDFTSQIGLGASYYGCANPGKIFAIASQIADGDFESAYQAYVRAGAESQAWAEDASRKQQRVSAREAYLWAANYWYAALYFLDGTANPSRLWPTWERYEACWTAATELFETPVERVEVPYQNQTLTGWFFRVDHSPPPRPLVILNNGADGSELNLFVLGAAGGLARGYDCLIFNGPGQGDALWRKKLYFRFDWEKVITPVVDYVLGRSDVDPKRIALIGISQGGYWVPRALAFEHRIAAGVADPGVWDLASVWTRQLPEELRQLLDNRERDKFNYTLQNIRWFAPRLKTLLSFRMRPYGVTSYYDAFQVVSNYHLRDVADLIRCPMLITNPESEPFFTGQPRKLFDKLRCPKTLIDFTMEQGANLHCEVNAPGYRDFQIYNWLDEILR
jgi:hypothetical protein